MKIRCIRACLDACDPCIANLTDPIESDGRDDYLADKEARR